MPDYEFGQMFDLSGKTVLITGGAGILGEQFCLGFLRHGAKVVVADLNGEAAEALAARFGDRVLGVRADVTDPQSVTEAVERTVERFGSLDVLINNAGGKPRDLKAYFSPFEDYSLDQWREAMSVNLDGSFLAAQAAGRQMVSQGSGSIVQIASVYAVVASDNRIYEGAQYLGVQINNPAVYSASKAAVLGLTRWLATYWATKGIRVNAIAPGGVFSGQNETFVAKYSGRVPMGRMAHLHEMVGTALYLASDASSYVTGQCLSVDGGLTAW